VGGDFGGERARLGQRTTATEDARVDLSATSGREVVPLPGQSVGVEPPAWSTEGAVRLDFSAQGHRRGFRRRRFGSIGGKKHVHCVPDDSLDLGR